jgi:hypothetical protein
LGSSNRISLLSGLVIIFGCLSDLFRLVVFLVKIWLPCDFLKTNLPVPVRLKRLAAARLVFIFGMKILLKPASLNIAKFKPAIDW